MAFCANCGNPLGEGQRFCPACGRPVGEAGAAAAPQAPQPEYAPPQPLYAPPQQPEQAWAPQQQAPPQQQQPVPPGYQPGWTYYEQGASSAPPRRSRKGLWIGLASAVVVIAVACVLVFVVFKGDIFGGGGASSPEQAARQFMSAFEDKDVDAIFDLLDPESLHRFIGAQSVDNAKESMNEALFENGGLGSIKFSGIEMSTEETGDDTATVTLTAGTLTVTDENGDKESSDVSEADSPPTIDLVRRDGSWYIDPTSMTFLGGMDGDDTTTTTLDDGPPTTIVDVTTTDTLFTTSTVAGGGSGARTPQEVVMRFFDAMEDKDTDALLALFDPVALEQMSEGVSPELLAQMLSEALFTYESVEFSGIEVDVEFADAANATVTVTAGTATMTASDGTVTAEDVQDSSEPFIFTVVERDGYWYADPSMFGEGV